VVVLTSCSGVVHVVLNYIKLHNVFLILSTILTTSNAITQFFHCHKQGESPYVVLELLEFKIEIL